MGSKLIVLYQFTSDLYKNNILIHKSTTIGLLLLEMYYLTCIQKFVLY